MSDSAGAQVEVEILALGEDTLAALGAGVSTSQTAEGTSAATELAAVAAGDELALTDLSGVSVVGSEGGSFAVGDSTTSGLASGDASVVTGEQDTSSSMTGTSTIAGTEASSTASVGAGSSDTSGTVTADSAGLSGIGDSTDSSVVVGAEANGAASGSPAATTATTETLAVETDSIGTGTGVAQAVASGPTDPSADASVIVDGDIAVGTSLQIDGPELSVALAHGSATTSLDQNLELEHSVDIDFEVDAIADVSGSTAQAAIDATAVGTDSLVDVEASVLTTDTYSGISSAVTSVVE